VAGIQAEAGAPPAFSPSLEPLDGEVWYLAFGSNMSPKVRGWNGCCLSV